MLLQSVEHLLIRREYILLQRIQGVAQHVVSEQGKIRVKFWILRTQVVVRHVVFEQLKIRVRDSYSAAQT
jgi:hypothetical protein